MARDFEVRDSTTRGARPNEQVEIESWPVKGMTYSQVWAMSTDDARDLYVTLGTFLEDE